MTILYQFHDQKALFEVPKICNINFWIQNDPSPFWHFSENSSDLVAGPFPYVASLAFGRLFLCLRCDLLELPLHDTIPQKTGFHFKSPNLACTYSTLVFSEI